uniref:hypothetical protein n=1 Tax=Syntrophaceticus schinkii TaxID=499207 RepID=UPI0038CD5672
MIEKYIDGWGQQKLAKYLNSKGTPGPRGKGGIQQYQNNRSVTKGPSSRHVSRSIDKKYT